MKGKIAFNKSGKNSRTARVNIPSKLYKQLNITEYDRDVELTVKGNKIIIEKINK